MRIKQAPSGMDECLQKKGVKELKGGGLKFLFFSFSILFFFFLFFFFFSSSEFALLHSFRVSICQEPCCLQRCESRRSILSMLNLHDWKSKNHWKFFLFFLFLHEISFLNSRDSPNDSPSLCDPILTSINSIILLLFQSMQLLRTSSVSRLGGKFF